MATVKVLRTVCFLILAGVGLAACADGTLASQGGESSDSINSAVPEPISTSSTSAVIATSIVVTSSTTTQVVPVSLAPDQPIQDSCIEPDNDGLNGDESTLFQIDPDAVVPGDQVSFRWDVGDLSESVTTRDELVVSCWNGIEWTPVWLAFAIFGDDSHTVVLTTETAERYVFTSDAHHETEGTIIVPADARALTYRVSADISFGLSGPDRETVEASAVFSVLDG